MKDSYTESHLLKGLGERPQTVVWHTCNSHTSYSQTHIEARCALRQVLQRHKHLRMCHTHASHVLKPATECLSGKMGLTPLVVCKKCTYTVSVPCHTYRMLDMHVASPTISQVKKRWQTHTCHTHFRHTRYLTLRLSLTHAGVLLSQTRWLLYTRLPLTDLHVGTTNTPTGWHSICPSHRHTHRRVCSTQRFPRNGACHTDTQRGVEHTENPSEQCLSHTEGCRAHKVPRNSVCHT